MATAVERIKHALDKGGKIKGFRGPEGQRQMVELVARDVVEACDAVADPDEKITVLRRGSAVAANPERLVVIYADDAFHIVEKANG